MLEKLTENTISKKKRVLFTGNATLIINGMIKNLPEEYQSHYCQADDNDLSNALEEFVPHALVICLLKESAKMLIMYNILERNPKYLELPVIAIGNEEDCELFKNNFSRDNIITLTRPLNNPTFLATLSRFTNLSFQKELPFNSANLEIVTELEKRAKLQVEAAPTLLNSKASTKVDLKAIQGRKTILVVDDDVRILNIIKLYLQDIFDVVAVPSGKMAIKYLTRQRAHLVLLDYMMPDEDGPAVLRQIRANFSNPYIPVLFLTGVAERELVIKGLECRPDGYCLKPISQEALIERITSVLLTL